MGQIYEAVCTCKTTDKTLQDLKRQLPMVTAKLLLHGLPFEIMDGDAANVPIVWVTAVLRNLKKIIGDKQLLALSVLGIQSSGKSTLLNAMFGLQFAVSAGRCTRGVFMQLVNVDDKRFPFDYILVIDTVGLRAPELGHQKYSHDNELATFVIGLGDITIVNIKGENTAEVKDVLQISVHAFMRLKLANTRLNIKQSCVFVHQNVPAFDANDKMMCERQKFVDI
ncbi:Interferon-induced very large GTPase 1 [Mytilus coruscus]|uniref:Interferon-induced very large GTPase 1 n=1 Tax=Mytilus coruscus TaxID=42192 RepID=A0A6J8BHC5_MYTCO|nr:Interferon-induced very large GTPase 1 [Mytilus coruscus]